jgi:hypothetical protein
MIPSDADFDRWLELAERMYTQGITSRYTPRQLRSLSGTLRLAALDAESIRELSLVPGLHRYLPARRHRWSEEREASRWWRLVYERGMREAAATGPSVEVAVTAYLQQTWDTYPDPLHDLEELTKVQATGSGATYVEWQGRVEGDLATFSSLVASGEQTIGWLIAAPTVAVNPPRSNAEIRSLLRAVDATDRLVGGAIPDRPSAPAAREAGGPRPEHVEMAHPAARGLAEAPAAAAPAGPGRRAGASATGDEARPEGAPTARGAPSSGPGPRGRPGPGAGGGTRHGSWTGAGGRTPLPHEHLLLPDAGWVPKDPRHRVFSVTEPARLENLATDSWLWEIGCRRLFEGFLRSAYGSGYRVQGSWGWSGSGEARRTTRPGRLTRGVIALMGSFGPRVRQRSTFDGVAIVRTYVETTRNGRVVEDHDPSQDVIHIVEPTQASYQRVGYKPGQVLSHLEAASEWVQAPNPRAIVYTIMTDRAISEADAAHFAGALRTVEQAYPHIDYYIVHRLIEQGPRRPW